MLKTLVWKERREQRALVLAGVLVAVLLPFGTRLLTLLDGAPAEAEVSLTVDTLLLWTFVIPAFAAAIGATATIADRIDDSLGFLLTRPVSGWVLFAVKLGVGLVALGLVVLAAVLGPRFSIVVTDADVGGLLVPAFADPFPAYGPEIFAGTGIVGLVLLAFSFSALAGLEARTALIAAGLGAGAAVAAMLGLQTAWKFLGEPAQDLFLLLTVGPALMVALTLGARRFGRTGDSTGSGEGRWWPISGDHPASGSLAAGGRL